MCAPGAVSAGKSAVAAFRKGLDDLEAICSHMLATLDQEMGMTDDVVDDMDTAAAAAAAPASDLPASS